jgi:hypothetical protein
MRIVMSFQYFPETKREVAHIVILDNESDIWICYSPEKDGAKWRRFALPAVFDEEDDDAECC